MNVISAYHDALGRPWVQCARCERLVDSMGWTDDMLTMEKIFWVECHGEREITRLSRELLMSLAYNPSALISLGRAFIDAEDPIHLQLGPDRQAITGAVE